MGHFENQNILVLKDILDIINEKKEVEYYELISDIVIKYGKNEPNIENKIKLLCKGKKIKAKKKGEVIFLCPFES